MQPPEPELVWGVRECVGVGVGVCVDACDVSCAVYVSCDVLFSVYRSLFPGLAIALRHYLLYLPSRPRGNKAQKDTPSKL